MATGEIDDQPAIYRIRNEPPSFASKPAFPHLLVIIWSFDGEQTNGMPSVEAVERMDEFEDLLYEAFEISEQAFLTMVATSGGSREWHAYVKDPQDLMDLVNDALGEEEPFPVEFHFQDDPDWESYTSFLEALE